MEVPELSAILLKIRNEGMWKMFGANIQDSTCLSPVILSIKRPCQPAEEHTEGVRASGARLQKEVLHVRKLSELAVEPLSVVERVPQI